MLVDWDAQGWQRFVSDPAIPAIMQEAGHKARPRVAALGGHLDAQGVLACGPLRRTGAARTLCRRRFPLSPSRRPGRRGDRAIATYSSQRSS